MNVDTGHGARRRAATAARPGDDPRSGGGRRNSDAPPTAPRAAGRGSRNSGSRPTAREAGKEGVATATHDGGPASREAASMESERNSASRMPRSGRDIYATVYPQYNTQRKESRAAAPRPTSRAAAEDRARQAHNLCVYMRTTYTRSA